MNKMSLDDASPATDSELTPFDAPRTVTYSAKSDPPSERPDVLLLFHGLLWFTFHAADDCKIEIHNTTKGHIFTHRYPHELDVTIWKITNCGTAQRLCTSEKFHIGDPKTIEGILIDVNNPKAGTSGVHVYQHDPFTRPDP